jgi:Tfp pilus assembly protein PilE
MNKGFTLIETIVYLALFALVISGIVTSMYDLYDITGRNQSKALLQEEKDFLSAKIGMTLQNIDPTKTISPAANSAGAFLSATSFDGTTNTISLASGQLLLNALPLNNTNVTISNLVFIHSYAGGANPESIEAGFTISERAPNGMLVSQSASTTRYLRK